MNIHMICMSIYNTFNKFMNKVYLQKAYFLTSMYYLLLFKLLHVYI